MKSMSFRHDLLPAATWTLMPSRLPSMVHSRLHSGFGLKLGRLEGTQEGTREGKRHFASARNAGPDRPLLRVTAPLTGEAA